MNVNREYKCTECANKGTPICAGCNFIMSRGKVCKKPTEYVDYLPVDLSDAPLCREYDFEQGDFAFLLIQTIRRGMPLPMATVMEYNRATGVVVERVRKKRGGIE